MEIIEPIPLTVELDDVRLAGLDWGGDGDPIVVLHATGFLGRVYSPIARALRSVGHVYTYDQRGHGDSTEAQSGRYDWYATVADLAGFITTMKLGRVRAFGHSAGATAIGALSFERPDLISRAVLAEPVIFETPTSPELGWRNPFVERTLKRRREFDSVAAMFESFDRKPPYQSWRDDMLHDYCEFGTRETKDGRRELKCRPEVEARFYESSSEFDGLGRILRSSVPLLVMFGQRPDSLGAALADRVAERLRNGRVMKVADAGHFVPMEQTALVAGAAVEFLSEK